MGFPEYCRARNTNNGAIALQSTKGLVSIQRHIGFIQAPQISFEESFMVASLSAEDDKIHSGFFPVKVAILEGGGNLFMVIDREATDNCFRVLSAGTPMTFMVFNKKECLAKVPLENDASFLVRYTQIENRLLGSV